MFLGFASPYFIELRRVLSFLITILNWNYFQNKHHLLLWILQCGIGQHWASSEWHVSSEIKLFAKLPLGSRQMNWSETNGSLAKVLEHYPEWLRGVSWSKWLKYFVLESLHLYDRYYISPMSLPKIQEHLRDLKDFFWFLRNSKRKL